MDNPTLTLVDDSTVATEDATEGRGSNLPQVGEGAWLIDACDLEGVEAEEVEEDGVATAEGLIENQGSWATGQIGTGSGGNNDDRDNNQQDAFEFLGCSECEARDRRRPVKEICGHVKCRTCYISSEDGCRQCINMAELVTDQTGSGQALTAEGGNLNPEQEEEDEGVKRIVVRPNEFILELGESSGNRSIAVVSSETLKELGIPHPDQESIGDGNGDKERETENSQNEAEDPPPITSNSVEDTTSVSNNPEEPVPENVSPFSKVLKKKLLTDHVISLDGGSHKYKCTKCEKEFSQDYQRKYHAYCDPENGRRPYVCQICLQEFISQSHFLYHERSKHTGEKPYECQICFKRFLQKVKLNRHMTFHTSKPEEKSEEASTYICGYCRKRFSSLSSCRRHIRNHTEDRAFSCPTCDKSFKQKYALDVHIKTHLNERPYKCPDCERAFSNAKDMRRHYLCHTGELPFQCQFGDCNAKFRRKDNLERHIRKMHKLPDKTARILGNEAAKQYLQSQSQKHKNSGTARRGQSNAEDIADVITGI